MKYQPYIIAAVLVAAFVAWRFYSSRLSNADADAIRKALSAGAKIIDVRTPVEFQGGHIDGAINIPLGELSSQLKRLGKKKAPLVLYCRSGSRSGQAASFLRSRGYQNVHDLKTMRHWRTLAVGTPGD